MNTLQKEAGQKAFDGAIIDLAFEAGVETLLAIPGVWEVVSEHFNNDAIKALEAATEEDDEHGG